jgi:hypothetical protein
MAWLLSSSVFSLERQPSRSAIESQSLPRESCETYQLRLEPRSLQVLGSVGTLSVFSLLPLPVLLHWVGRWRQRVPVQLVAMFA